MPKINVKDQRRRQLMEAAIDSIAKRGIHETTITHISQGAGMSRGIVNFYFTSKEQMMLSILKFLVEEYEDAWQGALEASKGKPASEQLRALLFAHLEGKLVAPKRLTVWMIFAAHASTHKTFGKVLEQAEKKYREALHALVTAGSDLPEERQSTLVLALHAMTRGLWHLVLSGAGKSARSELQHAIENLLDSGRAARVATAEKTTAGKNTKAANKKAGGKKEKASTVASRAAAGAQTAQGVAGTKAESKNAALHKAPKAKPNAKSKAKPKAPEQLDWVDLFSFAKK